MSRYPAINRLLDNGILASKPRPRLKANLGMWAQHCSLRIACNHLVKYSCIHARFPCNYIPRMQAPRLQKAWCFAQTGLMTPRARHVALKPSNHVMPLSARPGKACNDGNCSTCLLLNCAPWLKPYTAIQTVNPLIQIVTNGNMPFELIRFLSDTLVQRQTSSKVGSARNTQTGSRPWYARPNLRCAAASVPTWPSPPAQVCHVHRTHLRRSNARCIC